MEVYVGRNKAYKIYTETMRGAKYINGWYGKRKRGSRKSLEVDEFMQGSDVLAMKNRTM